MWNLAHASETWAAAVLAEGGDEAAEASLEKFEENDGNKQAIANANGLLDVIKQRKEAGQLGGDKEL